MNNSPFSITVEEIPLPVSPLSPFAPLIFPRLITLELLNVTVKLPSVEIDTVCIPIPSFPFAPTILPTLVLVPLE